MPVISLFFGSYCHGPEVARSLAESLGYSIVDDEALVAEAAGRFDIEKSKIQRALTGKTSVFNKFTREKERAVACLKAALAEKLEGDNLLFFGYAGLMIPGEISHALKVCGIADLKYRTEAARDLEGLSEREALKKIHKDDESRALWVEYLFRVKDPWAPSLYDIVIPMYRHSAKSAADLVSEYVQSPVLRVTAASRKAVADFILASRVGVKLAAAGHDVDTTAIDGRVVITINKHALMLSSLEEELKRITASTPGVVDVETRVGPGYYQSDIYRRFDFDLPSPSKVLLVDDEREFAQTLSERLQMRDLGSAVAYGGEEALSVIEEDEPEVMVLDLKMPGVDGLEVLRRVKKEHPDVEVIVLTGHGSKEIEDLCLEMGACAYLEKPVDIDALTKTMRAAYEKVRAKKTAVEGAREKSN